MTISRRRFIRNGLAVGAVFGPVCSLCAGEETECYQMMRTGEVRPKGWLLSQMQMDLEEGIAGSYDRISSNVTQVLFASQQRKPGEWIQGSRGLKEKAWWAGEHEGYWMDGLIRMAVLTDDRKILKKSEEWADGVLKQAERSGYIGIYSPDTRFPEKGFDGELWTQSRVFQALIAWYEYSGDSRIPDAIEKTVHLTIDRYRLLGTYFGRMGMDGGGTHGVAYIDTLEWLWRQTGDRYYADAAIWLYLDICKRKGCDVTKANLLNLDKNWQEHTPHTAESLHFAGIAGFFSQQPDIQRASNNVYAKLLRHTNPGGGFVAGKLESIAGAYGNADEAGEYCSMTEAIFSLNRLFQYDGNLALGDWSEKCTLNAAQGARFHPVNTGVIYLSRDNRLEACHPEVHGGREIFSASHNAAACCTLNSIRLLPAYVEGMWFRFARRAEFLANLYGACELKTKIGGQRVRIIQETDYPFSDQIIFRIETSRPMEIDLSLRIPPNSGDIVVKADGAQVFRDGQIVRVSKTWNSGDAIQVDFDFQVVRNIQQDGRQAYYQWGPLVFALPIPGERIPGREISSGGQPTGFYDWSVKPHSETGWNYLIDADAEFRKVSLPGSMRSPWEKPPVGLKGTLLDADGNRVEVTLLPMGSSVLRRTAFPLSAADVRLPEKPLMQFRDEDDPMRKF